MGADGGVTWMSVCEPLRYDRVKQLLSPFYQFTDVKNADWQDDANSEFLDENSYISPPHYLVGTYGTSQDIDLMTLKDILECESDQICSDPSLTFLELLEDLETRPLLIGNSGQWEYLSTRTRGNLNYCYDSAGKHLSVLEIVLWDHLKYYRKTEEEKKEKLSIISDIKIKDWYSELNELVDSSSTDHDETWT